MTEIRKLITMREVVFSELGVAAARPIVRAAGIAVIRNPFAGKFVEDLKPLFEAGAMLGERLMPELVKLLDGKDDPWSFPHFDTITVAVADAPRPDEIVVVMAIADGGRLHNRCGTEPIR